MTCSLKLTLILVVYVSLATTLQRIIVPDSVETNQNFTVQVEKDESRGSYDSQFDSYRTFLVKNVTGDYSEQCILVNSTSMGADTVTVVIPPQVGESGDFYRIGVQPFNQDPNNNKVGSAAKGALLQSSSFYLNANENGGIIVQDQDTVYIDYANFVPCTSYNCVRACVEFDYPKNSTNPSDPCNTRPVYDCAIRCPDCSFPSWETLYPSHTCESSSTTFTTLSTSQAGQSSTATPISTSTRPAITSASTSSRSTIATTSSLESKPSRATSVPAVSGARRMAMRETIIMLGMGITLSLIGNQRL